MQKTLIICSFISEDGSMGIKKSSGKSEQTIKVVGITVGGVVLLLGLIILFVWNKKRMERVLKEKIEHKGTNELMLFSYRGKFHFAFPVV